MKVDVASSDKVFGLQASRPPKLTLLASAFTGHPIGFAARSSRQEDNAWRSVACYRSGTVAGFHSIPSILRRKAKAGGLRLNSKNQR